MQDTNIIIEVAKLDPRHIQTDVIFRQWREEAINWTDSEGYNRFIDWLVCNNSDYLTSRDAIIPVIEKHEADVADEVCNLILKDLGKEYELDCMTVKYVLLATPKALCIALLKAKGKWKY